MEQRSTERAHLIALLAALEDPARAAGLPSDDPVLVKVARYHRLSPLLSIRCAPVLPGDLAAAFRRDRLVTTARNMMLGQVAAECATALGQAGIRSILLKGLTYEPELYHAAGARPSSDVDLLVPQEHRRRAFSVLDRMGFEPRAAAPGFDDPDYHEVAWTRAGVEVDLHLALAPAGRCQFDYGAIWADARPFQSGEISAWSLAPTHAVIFHALHMAIDHFDVPGIYLVDLAEQLKDDADWQAADETARRWHCHRPLATARALASAFLPAWGARLAPVDPPGVSARIIRRYGSLARVKRIEQLFRKLAHFDTPADAVPYVALQTRRNLKERFERVVRKRSARERLALGQPSPD